MFFGSFGAIFLLAQFFQVAQGYSPLEAGIRTLPWTAMPIFIAPIAGILSDRLGSRPLMATGLALQAAGLGWLAFVTTPHVAYGLIVPGFVMAGAGMAMVFAPAANAVLGAVRPEEAGQASGATNTIREVGGVLGVAVLATVFTRAAAWSRPRHTSTASSRPSGSVRRCWPSGRWWHSYSGRSASEAVAAPTPAVAGPVAA